MPLYAYMDTYPVTSNSTRLLASSALRQETPVTLPPGLFTFGNRQEIMALAAAQRLPDISAYREFVLAGGMISYGASLIERSRQFGRYVGRILRGTKPADVPIDQPTRFELVVSLRSARALGLTIPQSLLLRADEVID